MQIDIGAYLGELLFDHQTVNVPGLGGFVTQYKPATIDQVQGRISPPGKSLTFNRNLVLDDGLLVNFIKEKHGLSYSEAQQVVAEYVKDVLAAIERREIVVFPNLGRLYRDFENNLQFLPDNTNFNTDVHGLPEVAFYPVARTEGLKTAAPAATPRQTAKPVADRISNWFQRNLLLIGLLSVLVVATGFYFIFFKNAGSHSGADPEKNVPASRFNVKPGQEPDDTIGLAEETPAEEESPAGQAEAPDEETSETDAPTLAPDQRFCVIRIGYFGNPDNVEKLVQDIFMAGFEPYTEPSGQLTLVGVQFGYNSEAEIQRTLEEVRNRFEPKAKVIRK